MLRFLLRRLALVVVICLAAVVLLFALMSLIPGDPATIALGQNASPELREEFRQRMGLDEPFLVRLVTFVVNVMQGDLGRDLWSRRDVSAIVLENLPYTLMLILAGLGWAMAIGIPLGCYSAVKRGSVVDRVTGVLSVGTISIPSFVVSIYALLLFAVTLRWFPAIGAGEAGNLSSRAYHLVLPAFAVGLGWVGYLARFVRASMLEVMNEHYIRTARAFGLPERVVIFRYALSVAILPTVTLLGMSLGGLLTSAVFAEVIFSRPGIGKLIYDSTVTRNFPVVIGAVLVTVFIANLCTVVSDLLVAALSPSARKSL